MTLIQRFGGALNLSIHFHMLFLDGAHFESRPGITPGFHRVKAPTGDELTQLTHTIAHRVGRYLERRGLLERDTGNCYLKPEAVYVSDEDPSNHLLGSSITYRIAVGPQEGRKAMTWVRRLKRVFSIEIEICSECGGDIRIIASIEDSVVIQKILTHLDNTAVTILLPDCRASPGSSKGLLV